MQVDSLKQNFAKNLIKLRKARKLTQSQLAQKLNYSDKAISKWECGDAIPDVATMSKIAKFFSVTIDELISKNVNILKNITAKNVAITLLGFFLVWLTTCVIYYFLNLFTDFNNIVIILLCALPLSMVTLTVFCFLWFNKLWQFIATSLLIWSVALACYFLQNLNAWFIFIIAIVLEILCIIWFWLRKLIIKNKKI